MYAVAMDRKMEVKQEVSMQLLCGRLCDPQCRTTFNLESVCLSPWCLFFLEFISVWKLLSRVAFRKSSLHLPKMLAFFLLWHACGFGFVFVFFFNLSSWELRSLLCSQVAHIWMHLIRGFEDHFWIFNALNVKGLRTAVSWPKVWVLAGSVCGTT